jgi:hypothetical protein
MDEEVVLKIIEESDRRNVEHDNFNPLTGEGSPLKREKILIEDFGGNDHIQYIPKDMLKNKFVRYLKAAKSFKKMWKLLHPKAEYNDEIKDKLERKYIKIRSRYDFAFWAFVFVIIHDKSTGRDIHFKLNYPQILLLETLEEMRLAGLPIRVILLKARQWGGSTLTQIYMAWIQLVHKTGWSSIIIAHQAIASDNVKGMFDTLINHYPLWMLYSPTDSYNGKEQKIKHFGRTGSVDIIPSRNCKIGVGTAESPESARSSDLALAHYSEVAYWKKTDNKSPKDIIGSTSSSIMDIPWTMIVEESTANGYGDFFYQEYEDAKMLRSNYKALFIAWFQIKIYRKSFGSIEDKEEFAKNLYESKENKVEIDLRHECGAYLWKLWESGASLEAINWYITKRKSYTDHATMAAEFPTDDIEAFKLSGQMVFDQYLVDKFKSGCKVPEFIGEVQGDGIDGKKALINLSFIDDRQGHLWMWKKPSFMKVSNRYIVSVDIGGRSNKADWSVIRVFDRFWMKDGEGPELVAQWYGHIDHDLLSWKAAQIAKYYNDALLVIESNTLETKDPSVDGDQSGFILNQIKNVYDNIYARRQSEEDIKMHNPVRYGFHTNTSTKPALISNMIRVVREKGYIERDERCLNEYRVYEKKKNGSYGAIAGAHDDILMSTAIALWVSTYEMDIPQLIQRGDKIKINTAISAATI